MFGLVFASCWSDLYWLRFLALGGGCDASRTSSFGEKLQPSGFGSIRLPVRRSRLAHVLAIICTIRTKRVDLRLVMRGTGLPTACDR